MKVDKQAYQQMNVQEKKAIVNMDPWRLTYHLMPPIGWLNDPNGLCQFQGVYHIYYQYSPDDVDGKTKLWGHYMSKDMLHFIACDPVLYEDNRFDANGVYSGSAFIKGDTIHYFYTGNYKLKGDYDYIHEGREHNTMHVESKDGSHMSIKTRVMANSDYPSDMSCHVRDPKIFEYKGTYYMVQGARDQTSKGCVLVFRSKDMYNWKYAFRIETKHAFGYMWECPDLFELQGMWFLIICPQGVQQDGDRYPNIYQTGYFPIQIDFENETYELGDFYELDRGFDMYAPQSFVDEKGRRIMIPWMGLPDTKYSNPTRKYGWQHALGMPRELYVRNKRLMQSPIDELKSLRQNGIQVGAQEWNKLQIKDVTFEMQIHMKTKTDLNICLRNDTYIRYHANTCTFTLQMSESGYGRTKRSVILPYLQNLTIFSDTSSLEIFLNNGEEVVTTRLYSIQEASILFIEVAKQAVVQYYHLHGYVIEGGQSE